MCWLLRTTCPRICGCRRCSTDAEDVPKDGGGDDVGGADDGGGDDHEVVRDEAPKDDASHEALEDEDDGEAVPSGRSRITPKLRNFTLYPWVHCDKGGQAQKMKQAQGEEEGAVGGLAPPPEDLMGFVRDHFPSAPDPDQLSLMVPDGNSQDWRPMEEADIEGAGGNLQGMLQDALHLGAPVFWITIL